MNTFGSGVGKEAKKTQDCRVDPNERDDATRSVCCHAGLVSERPGDLVIAVHTDDRNCGNGRRFAEYIHPDPEATKLDGQRALIDQVLMQTNGHTEHGHEKVGGRQASDEIFVGVVKPSVQVGRQ